MRIKVLFFSKYLIITFVLTFLFIPVTMSNSTPADQKETVETKFIIKKKLSIILDSLELEKQTRIRNDHSFEDLENESRKIRDSINTIKRVLNQSDIQIQKPEKPVQKKLSVSSFFKSLLKPENTFDWVIFIIGSITFLSVIVLLIGIGQIFLFNGPKKRKSSYAKKEKEPLNTQYFPSFSNTLDSVSDSFADTDKNINNLSKIIDNDIQSLKQFNTNSSPFPTSDLPGENTGHFDKGLTISEKIVNDANEGLTILEISRKYHISINKVSLILHMQGINKLKKR